MPLLKISPKCFTMATKCCSLCVRFSRMQLWMSGCSFTVCFEYPLEWLQCCLVVTWLVFHFSYLHLLPVEILRNCTLFGASANLLSTCKASCAHPSGFKCCTVIIFAIKRVCKSKLIFPVLFHPMLECSMMFYWSRTQRENMDACMYCKEKRPQE